MAIKDKEVANTVVESTDTTGHPDPVSVPGSKDNGTEAASTLHPGSKATFGKTELLASVVAAMGGMSTDEINKFRDSLTPPKPEHADHDANVSSIKTHASAAMKEDVVAMFEGQELSEETLNKAVTIFESAVHLRVEMENAKLEEEYTAKLDESVKEAIALIETRVDEYLDYVVEEWVTENEVAIDSQIKTDIALNLLSDMKEVLNKHNIEIPDDKVDVVEALGTENEELEEKLNAAMQEIIDLKAKVNVQHKPEIVAEMVIGLSENQKAKFQSLVESVDTNLPDEDYKAKLVTLREHYFKTAKATGLVLNEGVSKSPEELAAEIARGEKIIVEDADDKSTHIIDPEMKAIYDTLSRTARK